MAIDPLEIAVLDLSSHQVPSADDLLDGLHPMSCLYMAQCVVEECYRHWSAELSLDQLEPISEGSHILNALTLIGDAFARLVAACVEVDILPGDAIEVIA